MLHLQCEFLPNSDSQLRCGVAHSLPSIFSVSAPWVALKECDLCVAEFDNVLHREKRPLRIVHAHIDYPLNLAVSRNRDRGHGKRMLQECIHEDDAFDRPVDEHSWILFNQCGSATVAGDKVEVATLQQLILDPAQNGRCIALA